MLRSAHGLSVRGSFACRDDSLFPVPFSLLFCQPRQHRLLAQNLPQRARGGAVEDGARLEAFVGELRPAEDAGLSAQNHAGANVTWSPMPTWPAMTAPLPTVRGAGDAGYAMTRITSSPMSQLWPTWTRLSIFVPRRMRVCLSAPRSMVELAPISTSSSMSSVPCCGNWV